MYKVTMEKQCGCFKRSGEAAEKIFENKDDALIEATAWAERMNEEFCQKHAFSIVENGDDLVVTFEMNNA
jgi:hypothetical protein